MKRAALWLLAAVFCAREASALPLPAVDDAPISLEVTETSILAQRFLPRQGERPEDQGYFAWLNRLNVALGWKKLTFGARIDTSIYALRPEDRIETPSQRQNLLVDGSTRYRNAIYPAKLWLGYKDAGLEITAGDSYVQFGRGLVLSLRKVDELGIDTTVFGAKVSFQKDPFGATFFAGLANPARVDEPTGRALFTSKPGPEDRRLPAHPDPAALRLRSARRRPDHGGARSPRDPLDARGAHDEVRAVPVRRERQHRRWDVRSADRDVRRGRPGDVASRAADDSSGPFSLHARRPTSGRASRSRASGVMAASISRARSRRAPRRARTTRRRWAMRSTPPS